MTIHTDIVCSLCGCLCDDLVIETEGDHVSRVEQGCPQGTLLLQKSSRARPPLARERGNSVPYDQAIDAAIRVLQESRAPLLFGMQQATTDDQRKAIELAEQLGAVIDTSGSSFTRAFVLAFQQAGLSTCTLGEVKQRGDLVIFWGADPQKSHPRLIERLCEPASEFLPRGRADRTLLAVNDQNVSADRFADPKISLAADSHGAALAAVRQLIRNPDWAPTHSDGLPLSELRDLAKRMTSCRYGVIFFGPELAAGPTAVQNIESLIRLVTELNAFTRFVARPLTQPGAEQVLTWQTGFPMAVDFQQGFPQYRPGEVSAEELLSKGEVDSCLLIGSQSASHLSTAAQGMLSRIPTIVLDPPAAEPTFEPQVHFTTAFPGLQAAGTAYRLDGVALPLRSLYSSPYPAASEVLRDLLERIRTSHKTRPDLLAERELP